MLSVLSQTKPYKILLRGNIKLSVLISLIVPMLLALLFFAAGCSKKEGPMAKVGTEYITADDFGDAMIKRYRNAEFAALRTLEDRQTIVRTLVDNKLKLLDAYSMGLDQDSTIQAAAEDSRKMAAIQELYQVVIMDRVIPEEAVREQFEKMGEEIKARHILFRTIPDLTDNEREDVVKRAEDVLAKLKAGADFDSLARAVSEDGTTSQSGGDLGYFSWGRMVDEFQEAVFALEIGEMSDIVESSYGYHIILLEDRRPSQSRKSYEEEKENIYQVMRRTYQDELTKSAEEYLENIKEENELKFEYANIQKILDKVSDPSVPRNNSFFADFSEDEKNWIVATLIDDTIRVTDLDAEIAKTGPPRWRDQKSIIQTVERMVLPDFLAAHAAKEGLMKSDDVEKAYLTTLEIEMTRRVEKIKIDENIDLSDSTLLAYYNDHIADFMTDSTVEVQEIYIVLDEEQDKDLDYAKKIEKRALRGENFTRLVKKYSDRKSTLAKDGKIGPITSRQYGTIGKEAFSLERGEVSGLLKMGRRGYSIIKLLEKTLAVPKPFDEAKAQVERQVMTNRSDILRKAWLEELEKRYPVTIYDNRLMSVLPPPEKEEEQAETTTPTPEVKEPEVKTIPMKKKGEGN
jgi:parvulin-like peptidyl-prolyl isomerase